MPEHYDVHHKIHTGKHDKFNTTPQMDVRVAEGGALTILDRGRLVKAYAPDSWYECTLVEETK